MKHNDIFSTTVYIDVEEFQPISRRPLSSPDPLFRLVPFSPPYIPRSPESTPRSSSPTNYYPTSPGPVSPSPPYIPQSPEWVSGSVSPEGNYYPTSPGPGPQSPAHVPRSSEWVSALPPPSTLGPTSPPPVRQSPAYIPSSPQSVSSGASLRYYPTSPGPVPPSPPYIPRSPEWAFGDTFPETHLYYPMLPGPGPQSPAYASSTPQWVSNGTSPTTYYPTSPGPVPPSPPYIPRSPECASTSPSPVPLSPSSPAATDSFNELERELDGSWGRGRFVYNRARSIVAEEEEEHRHRGDRETSTEPFPELPDWEEEENTGRETKDDVQNIMVHEPAAAVPEEEEGELPDYQYYEQLDQDTAAETLIRLEEEHSVVENPYTAIAALNYEPARSNPYPSSPSSEIGMHQNVRKEHTNWTSSCTPFRSSSGINNPVCSVPQRLMGCVKVQKRVDRMMWNKVMQNKMVRMMEVCEKYAPADVLKGLKQYLEDVDREGREVVRR